MSRRMPFSGLQGLKIPTNAVGNLFHFFIFNKYLIKYIGFLFETHFPFCQVFFFFFVFVHFLRVMIIPMAFSIC